MKPATTIFLTMAIIAIFATSSYADSPTVYALVSGIVHDSDNPSKGVPDASITVTCIGTGTVRTATSGTVGHYVAVLECPFGNDVEVTVTKDGHSGSSTGTIDAIAGVPGMGGSIVDIGVAQVDVSIPEFPAPIIPALLSIASFGIISRRMR